MTTVSLVISVWNRKDDLRENLAGIRKHMQVQRKLDDFFDFEDELEVRDESTESKSTEPGSSAENAKR